ncbi:MAG: methylated-DNA--[protein]-cysteine S-methyltransferase [Candidatus Babeliales bacterium]|jgi:methylated-DNA-[protein]-cysteine S-methyltransferase
MSHYFTHVTTVLGNILLLSDGSALTGLFFENQKNMPPIDSLKHQETPTGLFACVEHQLNEYFCGARQNFDIPLNIKSGTAFQQKVWAAIAEIPYGDVLSYRQLAERSGAPSSIRAVAHATSLNPISLFIPCHRVIGSNGKLVGYAGGLERKRVMLEIEKNTMGAYHANAGEYHR